MYNLQKVSAPGNIRSQTYTNRPLTNILLAHYQDPNSFIADKVFPTVTVKRSTDYYFKIPTDALTRPQMQKRARGANPAIGNFEYDKQSFNLEVYALMVGLTDEDEVDMDEMLDWDIDAVEFLLQQARMRREIDFVSTVFKAGVWGTDFAGVASSPTSGQFIKWSSDNSTPIDDIRMARRNTLLQTGIKLNTLSMDFDTAEVLMQHPEIVDRINFGDSRGEKKATVDDLKKIFDLEYIHVGWATQNTAAEGAAANQAFIMGNGALLTFTPGRPGRRVMSSGYTFVWDVYSETGMRMRNHRENLSLTDFRIIDDAYKQQVVTAGLGVFFADTGLYTSG